MSNICQVCGTDNKPGTEYCEGCGVEMQSSSPSTTGPSIEPTSVVSEASDYGGGSLPDGGPDWDGSSEWLNDTTKPVPPTDEVETPAATAHLIAKRYGAITGKSFPLQGGKLTVGRFDSATGPVDIDVTGMAGAEHISRHHAEIYWDGSSWMVKDLGSANGVFVKRSGNDQFEPRLQEPAALRDGDEVAFGNVLFVYQENG